MKVSASQVKDGILQKLAQAERLESVELSIGRITDQYVLGKKPVGVSLTFGGELETYDGKITANARINIGVEPTTLNGVAYREATLDCRRNTLGNWFISVRLYRVRGWDPGTDAARNAYIELGRQICREYEDIARGLASACALVSAYQSLVYDYERFERNREKFLDLAERLQDVNP